METVYQGFVTVQKTSDGHEVVRTTNSVAVLVYVPETDQIVFILQKRPALCPPVPDGYDPERIPLGWILECPAGRLDKPGESVVQAIVRELWEEIGARVNPEQVTILNEDRPLAMSPGILNEKVYLAYVSISPEQLDKDKEIFGVDGEHIQQVFLPTSILAQTTHDDLKTWALVQWFLRERQRGTFLRLAAEGE